MTGARRRRGRLLVVGAVVLALGAGAVAALRGRTEVYRTFTSPAGRYQLVVVRRRPFMAVMPGQAGDTDGWVRLCDAGGRILREQAVEGPVSAVDTVRWERDRVDVKLIAEWPLSPPDQ